MVTRFQINSLMRKRGKGEGKTTNRPEQLLIAEIIENHIPCLVKTEHKVSYVTESHQEKEADIDIFVVYATRNIESYYYIRVMGAYHDNPRQMNKDDLQRAYLLRQREIHKIEGVYDLWYHLMPMTFKRNKTLLNRSDAVIAYEEVRKQLSGVLPLPLKPHDAWLQYSQHIRK